MCPESAFSMSLHHHHQSVLRACMEPSVTECASVRMVPNVTTSAELVPVPPAGWDHTVKRVSNKQMHSNSERFTFTYHKYHVYVISRVVSTTFLSVHVLYFPGHLSFSTVKCVFIPLMHWGLFFTRETGSLNQSWRATHPSCNLSVCKTECFWFPFSHWNAHSSHTVRQLFV